MNRPKRLKREPVHPNQLAPAHQLQPQEWRWIEEFLLSTNVARASMAAGFAKDTDLRSRPSVRDALRQAQIFRSSRTAVHSDMVLQRWWQLATSDVNEIVELRIVPCRRCWGRGHMYQFRDHELGEAERKHDEVMLKLPAGKRVEFDKQGGPGYTTKRQPHPECPACDGNGEPLALFKDTRFLSPGARILYNGVECKADGSIKLNLRDRGYAETMLAKHLGLLPTGHKRTLKIDEMSEAELEEFLTVNGVSVYVTDGHNVSSAQEDLAADEGGSVVYIPEEGSSDAPDPSYPAAPEEVG